MFGARKLRGAAQLPHCQTERMDGGIGRLSNERSEWPSKLPANNAIAIRAQRVVRGALSALVCAAGIVAPIVTAAPAQAADATLNPLCIDEDGNHIYRDSVTNQIIVENSAGAIVQHTYDHSLTLTLDGSAITDPDSDFVELKGLVPGDCGIVFMHVINGSPERAKLTSQLVTVALSGDASRDFYDEFEIGSEGLPLTPVSYLSVSLPQPIPVNLETACLNSGDSIDVPVIFDFPWESIGGNTLKHGDHSVTVQIEHHLALDEKDCPTIITDCPAGEKWNGTECVPITCPVGQQLNAAKTGCEDIVCKTGQWLDGSTCKPIICPAGLQLEGNRCVPIICPTGQRLNSADKCVPIECPSGLKLEGNVCVPITCPTGQRLDGNNCVPITCPAGLHLDGNICVPDSNTCPTGQWHNGSRCVPITCPTGLRLDGNRCVLITCPTGQWLNGNTCTAITCPTGLRLDGNTCAPIMCPTGQRLNGDTCVPILCYAGQHLEGNTCVLNTPGGDGGTGCPSGQHRVNGICVAITETCPLGQTMVNGVCTDRSAGQIIAQPKCPWNRRLLKDDAACVNPFPTATPSATPTPSSSTGTTTRYLPGPDGIMGTDDDVRVTGGAFSPDTRYLPGPDGVIGTADDIPLPDGAEDESGNPLGELRPTVPDEEELLITGGHHGDLAGPRGFGGGYLGTSWALLDLLLTITAVIMVGVMVRLGTKFSLYQRPIEPLLALNDGEYTTLTSDEKEAIAWGELEYDRLESRRRHNIRGLAMGGLGALAAVTTWFLTQVIVGRMVVVDWWTPVFAILLGITAYAYVEHRRAAGRRAQGTDSQGIYLDNQAVGDEYDE